MSIPTKVTPNTGKYKGKPGTIEVVQVNIPNVGRRPYGPASVDPTVTTPTPTPTPTPVPVPDVKETITHGGQKFELKSDGKVWVDGKVSNSQGVIDIFVHENKLYQQTMDGFWRWESAVWSEKVDDPRIPTPTPTPTPPPAPTPTPTTKATTRPVGSLPLSDAAAAAGVSKVGETNPNNAGPNSRKPSAEDLKIFRDKTLTVSGTIRDWYLDRVTGNYTGTTDEIIQWGAHKWGIDEDVMRSVFDLESGGWKMDALGDVTAEWPAGASHAIPQIRHTDYGNVRTQKGAVLPLAEVNHAKQSTAFVVDIYGAAFRWAYDGKVQWLYSAQGNGRTYAPGDQWGTVGFWFAGRWWTGIGQENVAWSGAAWYIAYVQRILAAKSWPKP